MAIGGGTAKAAGPRNPMPGYVAARAATEQSMGGKPSRYTPSQEEQRYLDEYLRRYDADTANANLLAFHRTWWLALSYFAGLQWVEWSEDMANLKEPAAPSWRVRHVANKILPNVLRNASRLVADPITPRSIPQSTDRDDIVASKLAEQLVAHLMRKLDYEAVRDERTMWAVLLGSGFTRVAWNPSGGRVVKTQTASVKEGEVALECIPTFCIRVPQRVTKHERLPWLIIDSLWTMDRIEQTFPDKAPYVTPETDEASNVAGNLEHRVASLVGTRGTTYVQDEESSQQYVRVREFFMGPTLAFPRGVYGIFTGCNIPLLAGENIYLDLNIDNPPGIPIIKQDYIPMVGRYFGLGLVEQLTSPQKEYNRGRSQAIENKDLMSRPKWLLPRGHGIQGTSITSRPGEIIEYNASLPKPEQVAPVPLPTYVTEQLQLCQEEIQDISATHDVSEAKAPASVRSGVAIQLLQSGDNAVIAIPKKQIIRADRRVMEACLCIAQKKYTEQRTIQVEGMDASFEVRYLKGADLRGHTTLSMTAESGLLDSKAARQQNVLDYVQLGILDPKNPEHQEAILKMLDVGSVDDYVRERLLDERNAQLENDMMSTLPEPGKPLVTPKPRDFEDHLVHIKTHNVFRKSNEYRLLPPQQQQVVDLHVQEHQIMLQAQLDAQMQADASQRGMPGEKGKPSPPASGASGQASDNGKSEKGSSSSSGSSGGAGSSGGGGSSGGE